MPKRDFVVATATLLLHNSALSCFILNQTFDMLQQQETLYFWYINFGPHVAFQIIKSNHSCRQWCTCELPLLHQFFRAWTENATQIECFKRNMLHTQYVAYTICCIHNVSCTICCMRGMLHYINRLFHTQYVAYTIWFIHSMLHTQYVA